MVDSVGKSTLSDTNPENPIVFDNSSQGEMHHTTVQSSTQKKNCEHYEMKGPSCDVSDHGSTAGEIVVQGDCHDSLRSICNDGVFNAEFQRTNVNKSGPKGKSHWSFSWKGKTQKSQKTSTCPHSDSDFETNNDPTETEGCDPVRNAKKKTRKKRTFQNNREKTDASSNVSDEKAVDDSTVSDEKAVVDNVDSSKCQPSSLASCNISESNESVVESGNDDSICIVTITESANDESCRQNVMDEASNMHVAELDDVTYKNASENATTLQNVTENPKMSYFDILMQCAKEKVVEKQSPVEACGEMGKEMEKENKESKMKNRKDGKRNTRTCKKTKTLICCR